jgi:hypothetical protein
MCSTHLPLYMKKSAEQIITHVNLENVLTGQEKIHEF